MSAASAALTLKMLLLGEDRSASGSLRGVGDEADKTSGRLAAMGKVAAIGLGAVAVGVGVLFKTGLDEQKDFLSGQAQLAAGIKSTGGAANVTVDHLEDLASSIQDYSGQTDDSIVASEQLLLTFTNIKNQAGKNNDVFDQTVKISADMAAKMGGDASASAIQLGKALNDPVKGITALTKVGVSFTQQQKDQIAAMVKAGDTMGAQKIILGELNTEFGGAAEAAGKSLPGQLAIAQRGFEDASQSLVTALLPAINAGVKIITGYLIPALKSVVAFFTSGSKAAKLTGLAIGVLAAAFIAASVVAKAHAAITGIVAVVQGRAAATTALQTAALGAQKIALAVAAAAQWVWNAALSANPIGLVVLAIAAFVGGLVLAYNKVGWFRDFINSAFNLIKDVVMTVVDFIKNHWQLLVEILTGPIGWAVGLILHYWGDISAGFTAVKDWILARVNDIVGFFTALPGRVAAVAVGAFNAVKDAMTGAWQWVIDKVDAIVNYFADLGRRIASGVSSAFDAVGAAFQWIYDHTIGPIIDAIRAIKDFFSGNDSGATSVPNAGVTNQGGPRGGTPHKAGGGWLSGPGSGTSDSIMAAVSNGEFVVNAAQASKYGGLLESINNGYGVPTAAFGGSSSGSTTVVNISINGQVYGSTTDMARVIAKELERISNSAPINIVTTGR